MVVIVARTILDGQVVRWYKDEDAAHNGTVLVAASNRGTSIGYGIYLEAIGLDLIRHAMETVEALKRGNDMSFLATHTRKGTDMRPVKQAT